MPKYRFKVTDTEGITKVGTLSGPDLESVRLFIEKKGYEVHDLQLHTGGELVYKDEENEFRGLVFERPKGLVYKPELGERLTALFNFESEVKKAALFVIATLSLFWCLISLYFQSTPRLTKKGFQRFAVEVTSEIRGELPADSELILELPDIPYEKSFSASEVVSGEDSYLLTTTIQTRIKPSRARVLLNQPGEKVVKSEPFILAGDPLTGVVRVKF